MNPSRLPPMFLAESRALDFLNTRAVPADVEVEWIGSGEDLIAWLQDAELITPAIAKEIRALANPGELDAVAAQARALREWFRGFVSAHRGKPLTTRAIAELEPLNRLLSRDQQYGQIVPEAGLPKSTAGLSFVMQRQWRSPEALLFPVARALAELVAQANFSYVKRCEGPNCMLHFLDTTRDARRRWCSMAVCGNRAKQAALRNRRAAAA